MISRIFDYTCPIAHIYTFYEITQGRITPLIPELE
jgi:hypothetical protein